MTGDPTHQADSKVTAVSLGPAQASSNAGAARIRLLAGLGRQGTRRLV